MKTPSSLALVLLAASVGASVQSDKGAAPVKAPAAPSPAAPKPVAAAPAATTKPAAPAPSKPAAPVAAKPAAAAPAKAAAPAPTKPAATPSPAPVAGPEGGNLIQSILEQETEIPKGGYVYNAAGRRDPFVSLAKPVASEESASRPRRPGIEGFMLQETTLKGVLKNIDGWIAILQGPDNKGYFVRAGQRMHDGVITLVDAAGLTFRQEITDPLSPAKSRDVRRLLNSAQEESNK